MGDRLFVCCAAADKARAEETCKRLGSAGLNIEIIALSNGGEREIENAIASARFVLVFFSNQSASDGEALHRHLDVALHSARQIPRDRVFIIPVRLEKCDVPESVEHLQLVDLFKEEEFEKIIEVIREELALFTDDRDGRVYRTIEIGNLTWLADNLNYEVDDSWWYDNKPAHATPFGRLYTWKAALAACPSGWHIPEVREWERLAANVRGTWDFVKSADAYKALTEEGGGFQAVLGGLREKTPFDAFYEKGQNGHYWGGNPQSGVYTFSFGGKTGRLLSSKADRLDNGFSCRCVRDL
jgi:uncharacterized protein (TIGR02145 family)